MDYKLNLILNKYESELNNYELIYNLKEIVPKTNIRYISKNTFLVKNGYFRKFIEPNIIELYINSNRIWSIYTDKYYFFYKKSKNELFRNSLQKLVDNNFKIIKKN